MARRMELQHRPHPEPRDLTRGGPLRDIPDASATHDLAPRPNICADAPATTRRCTSFKCGNTTTKDRASPTDVTSTTTHYNAHTI